MMPVYEIRPDDAGWSRLNSIEATHVRVMPGVKCPVCGVWATTGVLYPNAAIGELDAIAELTSPWPVALEEFKSLSAKIQPILGSERPVWPGAQLGHLSGRATGKFGDFAWVNPWTMLMCESVWKQLKHAGIDIPAVYADLKFAGGPHVPLVELEALPKAQLAAELHVEPCSICGRQAAMRPERLVLNATSIEESNVLLRIRELPTVLLANARLAAFIRENGFSDVLLVPVEISD